MHIVYERILAYRCHSQRRKDERMNSTQIFSQYHTYLLIIDYCLTVQTRIAELLSEGMKSEYFSILRSFGKANAIR